MGRDDMVGQVLLSTSNGSWQTNNSALFLKLRARKLITYLHCSAFIVSDTSSQHAVVVAAEAA